MWNKIEEAKLEKEGKVSKGGGEKSEISNDQKKKRFK